MLTRANSVCVIALSRSDWRVLALLLVRVDCAALCCAVLCCAVLAEQKSNEIQESFPTNNIIVGNYRLRRAERWEKIATISSPSRRDLSKSVSSPQCGGQVLARVRRKVVAHVCTHGRHTRRMILSEYLPEKTGELGVIARAL